MEIIRKNKTVIDDLPDVGFSKADETVFVENFACHQHQDNKYLKTIHEFRTQWKQKEK